MPSPHPQYLRILSLVNENFPPTEDYTKNPLANIENVVVYTRLSREDDDSHSPTTQLIVCRRCAKQQGWKIVKEFTRDADEPISGKAFEGRPGWESLVQYLSSLSISQRKKIAVLVYDFARFSRNLKEGLDTRDRFVELGVRIRSANDIYVAPEEDSGRFKFAMELLMAEEERRKIVGRTKGGLETAFIEGKQVGGKRVRHFSKDQDGRLFPDDTAMRVADLRARGVSYTQIGHQLNISDDAFHICEFLSRSKARMDALAVA
jgi:DNA invertase Pin-like site-specific DNA recombinase